MPPNSRQASADFLVAAAHRVEHAADGNPVRLKPVGINVDLVLTRVSADRRHFGHARHSAQVVTQVPVLIGTQVGEAVFTRGVDQRVLIDPAQSGRIGAQLSLHALGQPGLHAGQVLQSSRARPVEIGSIFEDHIHVGVAEVGDAAHCLDFRRSHHGGDNGIRDLVFDDIGAAIPARIDDDLGLAQVWRGVERQRHHGPPAEDAAEGNAGQNDQLVLHRKVDNAVDHGRRPDRFKAR